MLIGKDVSTVLSNWGNSLYCAGILSRIKASAKNMGNTAELIEGIINANLLVWCKKIFWAIEKIDMLW